MLSNKLLFALPLVASQAAAISLATPEESWDYHVQLMVEVMKVFYPDCEEL